MKTHNPLIRFSGVIFAIILLMTTGCSKKTDSPTGNNNNADAFASVIQNGGGFEPVVPDSTITEEQPVVDSSGTDVYYCTRRTVSLTDAPDQFATFM